MQIMKAAGVLRTHKYVALLALLLVMLAIQSLDAQPGAGRLFNETFRTVLGVAILFVVFERRRERTFMAAILAAAVAISWGRHLSPASLDYALSLALRALMSLYLWLAVWAILRDLFGEPVAGAANVVGAICGYIIAGDAWASTNAVAYLVVPAAYSISPEVDALLTDWQGRLALFSYYSYAQMLTLGYSDVTPVRAPATTLSLLGALFGLFYTAIVVSQFVGLAQSGRRETPS
jgi:voltage-gated potassium channel Kch